MCAEWPALGAHRHTTFAGLLGGGSARPARCLGRLPRTLFPAHGKRSRRRVWHAPTPATIVTTATAAIDVTQPGGTHQGGAAAAGPPRVDAGAVADELGGRSRLHLGRVVVEGEDVPGSARDATFTALALSAARAQRRGVRRVFVWVGRGGATADGRSDQGLPRHSCLSPPLRRVVPLGTRHTPPPRF